MNLLSRKKRALLSVSDKTGIAEFGSALVERGFEIFSTGGTKRTLTEAGVAVRSVSEITDFPEILDGRVKTLHPAIHAGLLATSSDDHQEQMADLELFDIHLVCVNLYPFKETIRRPGASFEDAVENIDIGGPTMIRAAAKNHQKVTVLVDSSDYEEVLEELDQGEVSEKTRRRLAAKAFRHTASYDALIAQYMTGEVGDEEWPEALTVTYEKAQTLRYGENPHQKAAFYNHPLEAPGWLPGAEQLHGKALSYNNINDANAALEMVREFDEPAAVAVKHMNPCGIGLGESMSEAFSRAREGDPVSIFGGIIALNRPVDEATAAQLNELFLEIVLAPSFEPAALEILQRKKNLRLLSIGDNDSGESGAQAPTDKLVAIQGGALIQSADSGSLADGEWNVVTKRAPTPEEERALKFAWKVVKHVKSNAIILAHEAMTVGIGAGQMNRVGAAEIAISEAADRAKGSVMASDAFFPMRDTVDTAAAAGITAIIQPGGSIRDEESIVAADEAGIAMVCTGMRHFKH